MFFVNDADEELIKTKWGGGVIEDVEYCFSRNPNKYYHKAGETFFNPFHSGQYTIFLYYLSRRIYMETKNTILADKIYYLNKALNGCDLFYEVEMPRFFCLDHPLGSVMGRAQYGEGFTFIQNCTVGNNKGIYPVIGKNVTMCSNSYILGNCHIGDNVIIGAHSGVKDCDIPSNTIVFGHSPNLIFKSRKE
jgi:serine O-acetyltransferase